MPEAVHHQLVHRFGSWNLGVEMADCILAEFRHRHNIRASERHRLGFPRIGHYDTWLTDKLQRLYLHNRGTQRYRGWTCACDYGVTAESFGVTPLSIVDLQLPEAATTQTILSGLSRDKAYLAERQGLKLPLLPVVGKDEKALFNRLMVKCPNDFENMASEWSKAVNGVSVFPKIPAQLRIYAKKWEKSVAVRKVLEDSAAGRAKVKEILSRYAVDTVPAPTMPLPISPTPVEVAPSDRAPPDSGAKPGAEIAASLNTVAGLCMQVDNPPLKSGKRSGERGKDVKPRKKRASNKCRRCLDNGGPGSDQQATECKGRGGQQHCQHFAA